MKKAYIFSSLALVAAAALAIPGCSEAAKQCGFVCPAEGVADGNASISGEANIDSFFGAVTEFDAQVNAVVDGLVAPMANIKASLGLDASADGAAVIAAIKAKYQLQGDLKIAYAAPKCEVSAKATVEATAKCDVDVEPGSLKAECSGSCEAEVKVEGGQASCEGSAELKCSSPRMDVACEGSCQGECKLDVAAKCEGNCKGTCEGECSVKNSDGSCNGTCSGNCSGTCEMTAGGQCSGTCSGECVVQADPGGCTGGAQIKCQVTPPSGSAKVECDAKCSGEVTPPKASAECEASAKADAELKAECKPPSFQIEYEFAAGVSTQAQADFEMVFLANFKTQLGLMISNLKKADIVLRAGANIVAKVPDVTGSFKAALEGDANAKAIFFLGCALTELEDVEGIIVGGTAKLTSSVSASASFVGGIAAGG